MFQTKSLLRFLLKLTKFQNQVREKGFICIFILMISLISSTCKWFLAIYNLFLVVNILSFVLWVDLYWLLISIFIISELVSETSYEILLLIGFFWLYIFLFFRIHLRKNVYVIKIDFFITGKCPERRKQKGSLASTAFVICACLISTSASFLIVYIGLQCYMIRHKPAQVSSSMTIV